MRFCASCGTAVGAGPAPGAAVPPPVPVVTPAPVQPVATVPAAPLPVPAYAAAGPVPCPRCGTEIRPPARFCRRCGTSATGEPPARKASRGAAGAVVALVVGAVAVGALVFFLSRGGDDDGTPAGGDGGGPGSGGGPTAPALDSAQTRAEMETLLAKTGDVPFKVVYDVTAEEKGTKVAAKGTLTIATAAPRAALVFDAGAKGLDLSGLDPETTDKLQTLGLVTDGQRSWLCQKAVGKDGECMESTVEPGDESADVSQLFDEVLTTGSEDALFQAREVKGQKIAGRDARCYELARKETVEGTSSEVSFTVCVDKAEGLPLLIEGKLSAQGALGDAASEAGVDVGLEIESVDASWSIKAKSVQFSVSNDDFKPLFKVTTTD